MTLKLAIDKAREALELAYDAGKNESTGSVNIVGPVIYGLVDDKGNLYKNMSDEILISTERYIVQGAISRYDRWGSLKLQVKEFNLVER